MVYYKLILLNKRVNSNDVYPIVIRITYNKNNTTLNTGVRVKTNQWEAASQLVTKSHGNFQLLNKTISEFYLKVQKQIHHLIQNDEFSFEALKIQLSEKPKAPQINFYEFSKLLIDEMHEVKRSGNAIVYQTGVNRLVNFYGNKNLTFQEITFTLLDKFRHKLTIEGARANTIGNYLRSIRAIYNKAIKARIADRSQYPFSEMSIKQERTAKRAITINDLTSVCSIGLKEGTPPFHARCFFVLSFFLIGISFTDLAYLKPQNIVKGRVIFIRRKTHKRYSIKLTDQAIAILAYYKGRNDTYLLPVLSKVEEEDSIEAKKLIHQWIKTTNKYLKRLGNDCGLESPLTTYVARHTWATTAKKLGYSNEKIAEAMGHEYGNKITNIYLDDFDQEVIDEVNQRICYVIE
ncbi:MAG TPA: site-specific integrase [Sphingobacteriaceae bacterium]|nr:site-specific integrase [Sphingobacteriaceae bacterium]